MGQPTITHPPAPPKIKIWADQYTVPPATPVTISWSTQNADSCKASEDWSGPLELSGQKSISLQKSKSFFAITCQNAAGIASRFINTYIEDIPSVQNQPSIQKNINWIIVFTYTDSPMPGDVKDDLCNSSGTNRLPYLPIWFKREASRYGIQLSMTVQCYDQQIQLPQDVLSPPDTYFQFGQVIPLPLNMQKTSDYILQTIPSLSNYDLITVLDYRSTGAGIADKAIIGKKVSYSFLTKDRVIDGVQYYNPNLAVGHLVKAVAHEALHSLGAYDHYTESAGCLTEPDKTLQYASQRIMCNTSVNDFQSFIIPIETAKEIGWIK